MSAANRYWVCSCVMTVLAGCHLIIPYDPVQEGQETGVRDLDQRIVGDADLPRADLPRADLPPIPSDMPIPDLPPLPPDMGCLPGEALCSGVCVKVKTDPNNCGSCGNVCDDKEPCTQNNCQGGSCNFPAEPTGTKCTGGACAKVPTASCCFGCLDGDQCRAGTGNGNCGKGGAKCNSCTGGLICNKQACTCEPNGGCKGCCTKAKDKCVQPATHSECGVNGTTCQDCTKNPSKKKCQQTTGKCTVGTTTTCTVACSSGCCSGGACKPGITNGDCGKGGGPCEDCITKSKPVCITGHKCNLFQICEAIPEPKNTPCTGGGVCCNGVCKNILGCP